MRKITAILISLILTVMVVTPAMAVDVTGGATVTNSVVVSECPLITSGFIVESTAYDFGSLLPGHISSNRPIVITTSASGGDNICNPLPTSVSVSIVFSQWIGLTTTNTMLPESTSITGQPNDNLYPIGSTTLGMTVTPPVRTVPDTYTQIITLTATS